MNFPFLKPTAWITCICFTLSVLAPSVVQAQAVAPTPVLSTPVAGTTVPSPGQMIGFSQPYTPAMITGVKVHPENPFAFDFIVDSGDSQAQEAELREEIDKLVQYFFTSLTVPEDQMWVNLSPHEKDRIMADHLSHTAMGRELLAQDYLLKQITATAFYPEEELGARFWERIRERAQSEYNITDIPTDTFNKVWIVPQKATVYVSENTAYITESRLKVMLEEDYLGVVSHQSSVISANKPLTTDNWKLMTTLIKEVILPALEAEVNTGANFAPLRQAVNSMILATWYKKNLKESILAKKYVDQNIVTGVDLKDQDAKEKIYQLYIEAFNKGVYDYIREEYDPSKQEIIPKKYFSGGIVGELAQVTEETTQIPSNFNTDNAMLVSVVAQTSDPALNTAIRQATDQAMSKENGEDSRDLTRIESEKKSTEVNSADTNYLSLPPQHLTTIKAFSVLVLSFIALYDVNLMSLPSETLKSFLVKMGILAVIVSVVMRKLRSRVVEQQLESREEEELKKDLSTEKLTGGENDQALLNDGRDDQIQIDPRDERLLDLEERQQWLELKQMRKGVFMAITFVSFLMAAVLGWINAKSAFVLLIVMCLVFLHMADDGTIEQIVEVKKEKKKLTKSEQGASRTLTSGQEDQPDNALLVWDREVKALSVQDQVTALASEVEYLRGTLQKEEKVLKQREYELDRMRERVAHVRNFEFIDNELLREFVRQPLILLCIVFALWGLQLGGFIADGSVLEKIYYGLLVYFPFFYPALLADRERAHRIYAAQVSKILKLEAEVREKETQLKRITEDSTRLAAPEEIDRAMSASRPEDSNPNGEINVTLQNNFGKAAKRTALEKETRDLSTEISLMQEEYDVLNERVVKLGKLLEGGVFIHIFGVFAIMQVFLVIGITFQFGLGIFDSFLNFLLVEVSSLIFSPIVTFWQRKSWEKEIKEKKKDMDKLQQKLQQNKHKLIGIKGRLGLPSAIEGEESRISAEEDVADHAMGTLRDVRDEVERLWNARHRLEKYIEELNGRSLLSILKRWKFSLMFPVTAAGFFFLDRTLINPISLGVAAAVVIAIDFFVFKKRQSVLRDLIREERKKIRKLNEAIDEAGWGTSSRIRDDNQTDRAMLAQSAVERPVSILSSSTAEIQQSVDRLKYLLFQWEELSYFILSPGDFSSTAMTLAGLRLATSPFYTVWRSFAIQQEQARLIESLRSEMRWLQDLINTHKGALSAEDLYKIRIISIRARHAFQASRFFQLPSTKFQMAKLALVSGDAAMSAGESKVEKFLLTEELQSLEEEIKSLEKETEGGVAYFKSFVLTVTMLALPLMALYLFPGVLSKIVVGIYIVIFIFAIEKMISGISALLNLFKPFNVSIRQRIDIEREIQEKSERVLEIEEKLRTLERGRLPEEDGDAAMTSDELQPPDQEALRRTIDELQIYKLYGKSDLDKVEKLITFLEKISRMKFVLGVTAIILTSLFLVVGIVSLSAPFVAVKILMPIGILIAMAIMVVQMVVPYDILKQKKEQKALIQQDLARIEKELTAVQALLDAAGELKRIEPGDQAMSAQEDDLPKGLVSTSSPDDLEQMYRQEETPSALIKKRVDNQRKALEVEEKNMDFFMNIESDLHITLVISFLLGAGLPGFWMVLDLLGLLSIPWYEIAFWKVILIPGAIMFFVSQQMRRIAATHLIHDQPKHVKKAQLKLKIAEAELDGNLSEFIRDAITGVHDELVAIGSEVDQGEYFRSYGILNISDLKESIESDPWAYYQEKSKVGRWRRIKDLYKKDQLAIKARDHARIMADFGLNYYNDDHFRLWLFNYGFKDLSLLDFASPEQIQNLVNLYNEIIYHSARASDVDYRVVNDEEEMNRFIQSKVVFLEREGEYLSGEYVKERDVKTVLLFRGNRIIGYVLLTLSEADSSQEVNVHKIFISPEYEAEQSEVILKAQMTLLGQSVSGEDGDQRSVVSDQADVPGTLKGDRLPEGDGDQAMTAREGKPGTDVMRPSVLELEQEMREKEKIPMMSEYNDLIKYLFRIFKKFELNILKRILDPKEMTRFFNFLYVNGFSMGGAPASYVTIAILMLTFTGGFTGLGLSLNLISFLIFVTAFFPLLIGLSILIGTIDARNIQQLLYKKGRSFKKLTLGLEIRRAIKYGAVIEYVGSIVKKLNFGLQEQEDDSDWELYYGVHRLASLWALRTNNDDPRSYYQAKATTAGRLRHRWNIIRGHWNEVRAKENAQIMLKFMDLYEDDAFRFWLFEYGLEDLELIEKTSPQDIEDLMYLYSMTGSEASVADEGKINFRRLGQDDLDSVIRLTRVMFSQNKRPDESRFSEEDKVTVGLFADDLLIGYVVFEQEGDTLKDKETFIAPVSNITIDDAIKQAIFAVLESKALPANVPGALKGDRLPEEVSDQAMGSWNSEEDPFQRMERQKEEVGEIIEAVKEYLKRQNDIEKNKDQIYNAVFYPTLFAALLVVVFSGKFLYALINVSMSFILGTVTLFPLAYVLYLVHKKKMDYPRRIISFEDDINEATSPQEVAQIHHIVTSSFDAFKERYDLFVEYEEFDQALSAIPPENQEDGEISPNPRSRFGGVEADQAMLGLPVEVLTDPNVLGGVAIALAAAGKWIKSKRGRLHLSAELNLENQVAKGRKAREIVTLSGEKFWEPRLSKETVRLILKKKLSPVERQQRDDQVKKFILQKVRFGDLILQGKLATPREKDRFLNERLKEGSFNSFGKDLIEDADVAKAMAALKSKGDFTTMLSVTYNGSYDVYSLDIIPTDLYENPPYMNRYQYGYTYEDDRIVFSDGYPEGFRIDFSRTDDSFTLMTGWDLKFKIRKTSSGTLIESGRGELNIDAGDIVGIVPSSLNATENRIVVIFKDSVDLNAIKLHDPSNSEFRVEFIHESSVEQYLDASGYELLSRLQVLEWSRERRAKHLDDYLFSVIKSATDAQKQRLKERIIKQIRHKIATGLYTYIHYGDRKASVSYWVEERLKKDIDRKSFVTGEDILSAIAYLIRDGDFQVVIYGSTNELKGEWATLRIKSVNTSPEQFDSDRPPLIPEGFNFVEYFDLALTAEQAAPGGIDLNPQNLELRQEGEEIHFDLPEAFRPFADVPINRLTPVIINITPIPSVPLLLGLEGFALDGGLTRENTHSPSPNIYHVWLRRNCPFKVQTRNEVKFFLPVGRQGA